MTSKVNEREMNRRGTRHQKQARGAGMQGTTGTWGVGQGQQDSECRTNGGDLRECTLFWVGGPIQE